MRIGLGIVTALATLSAASVSPAVALAQDTDHAAGHEAHMDMEMPTDGIRADVVADIERVEEKVVSLAEAMSGHWDWRPGDGVRSVGEVYGHIAASNMMIPMLFGIMPPESYRGADQQTTMGNLMALEKMGPDELMEELKHSFMHARHAVARVPDDRLGEMVQYFGQEGSVRELMLLFATHMHEHLGQSIAYARTNGVVPPWSAGGM